MGGTTPTKKSRKKHPGYHKAGLFSWVKDVSLGGKRWASCSNKQIGTSLAVTDKGTDILSVDGSEILRTTWDGARTL